MDMLISKDAEKKAYDESQLRLEALAKELTKGKVIVLPGPEWLFVDLDDEYAQAKHADAMKVFRQTFKEALDWKFASFTFNACHVYVKVEGKTFSDFERVALQACLGSDPVRESLSYLRNIKEGFLPVLFFAEKDGSQERFAVEQGLRVVRDEQDLKKAIA